MTNRRDKALTLDEAAKLIDGKPLDDRHLETIKVSQAPRRIKISKAERRFDAIDRMMRSNRGGY